METKKFQYIDALRGFAVLGVIMVHSSLRVDKLPLWLYNVTNQGSRGVQLFFIVSALTMFMSMESRSIRDDEKIGYFFIRRFFRIAPMFYIAAILYSLKDLLLHGVKIDIGNVIGTLTFILNGFNPYWMNKIVPGGWSVTVEMSFYLFLPFLFKKITNIKRSLIFIIFALMVGAITQFALLSIPTISHSEVWRGYLFYWFPNQLSIFGLGILLYHTIKNNPFGKKLSRNICNGLMLVLIYLMYILSQVNFNAYIPTHFIFSITFAVFAYFLYRYPSKLFSNKISAYVGKISFSCYLVHFMVFEVMDNFLRIFSLKMGIVIEGTPKFIVLFLSTTLITIIFSTFTYRYIEKPGIDYGKRLIAGFEKKKNIKEIPTI